MNRIHTKSNVRRKRRYRKPEIYTVRGGKRDVKIYRHRAAKGRERPYLTWQVADYLTGERRLSTFRDHAMARRYAERIAGQMSAGQALAATMLDTEAASYGRAVELLRPTGVALEVAAAIFAKCFEILGGDNHVEAAKFYARHRPDLRADRTVAEVIVELIEAKKARGMSDRYTGDLSSRLNRFAKDYGVDISSVTTANVQHWLDGLKVAPQTAKNFRTVLYTLFQFAEARGYIFKGGNPVANTERIDTGDGGAIEIYTPAEMLALLTHAPKTYVPLLALGAFAGLRSAEIYRLEWSDVDLTGGFIHIAADKAKTRSRRLVPILPNLAKWLAKYSDDTGKIWKGTDAELKNARAETVKAAETPWKDNALRHSFISYRLADIQDVAQVALEAGNTPDTIFAHYRELVKPEAATTWFSLAPAQPKNIVTLGKAASKRQQRKPVQHRKATVQPKRASARVRS